MKNLKKYLKIILGSFIIAVALNLFFKDFNLIPSGLFGFSVLYSLKMDMNLYVAYFLINLMFMMIGILTYNEEDAKKLGLCLLIIPALTYLTSNINTIIDLKGADTLLIAIFGGVMIGLGSSLIYHSEKNVSGDDIISKIGKEIIGPNGNFVNYIFDAIILVFTYLNFGVETALYSLVSIVIIQMMRKKSIIGISEAKVFYIITSEETKVKRFILNELHYDLTIFDAKGGYSHNKNRILMTAIPTKEYYKLREGIKDIDPHAFISITDSYEIINDV